MGIHRFISEAISDHVLRTGDVFEHARVKPPEKEGSVIIERP